MPARGRIPGARNRDSRKILEEIGEFLRTHLSGVTPRMCLYRVVSLGLLPSTEQSFEIKLYGLLSRARVAGEIDDAPFVDDHCSVEHGGYRGYQNLDEFLKPPDVDSYVRNRWRDQQPKHPTQ